MAIDVKKTPSSRTLSVLQDPPLQYSFFWFFFFLQMIAVVGGVAAYAMALPLMLLGRMNETCWRWGGRILCAGVSCLLNLEPWLDADILLELPTIAGVISGPFVTVSNHRSHLDMFFLLSKIPNIRVIAKQNLFYVPFLGLMMKALKTIPVRKGNVASYLKGMETAKQALKDGDPVHIFPEMTRCEPGFQGVQAFHLAPFHMIHKMKVPLVPIVFVDTDRIWPKGKNALSFRQKAYVKSLPALRPQDYPNAESLRQAVWEQIQNALLEKR